MSNSQINAIHSTYENKLIEVNMEIRKLQRQIDVLLNELQAQNELKVELQQKLENRM
jgi:uncharacterized coiled-coil protein SlyX